MSLPSLKNTKIYYILHSHKPLIGNKMKLLTIFLSIFLFSSILFEVHSTDMSRIKGLSCEYMTSHSFYISGTLDKMIKGGGIKEDKWNLIITDIDLSNGTAKVGDVVLTCDTEDLPVGSSVMVAIRPEDIYARNITNTNSNIVQIEVLHVEFLGSFCRVKLGGGDLNDVSLRADFSISLTRLLSIKVGLKFKVSLPSKLIRIYLTD